MKLRLTLITVVGLLFVVGLLAGIKMLQFGAMAAFAGQQQEPPAVVTSAPVTSQSWEQRVTAVGSLEAVQGVVLAAELNGRVVAIPFEPGSKVTKGTLLLQQDTAAEEAQLRAAEAAVELAKITLKRSKKMLATKVVSASDYDNASATLKQAQADADAIRATIAKKTIRAPFSGRLGIRQVHLGQILKDGSEIVSLQSLDPIFVNFQVPQQQLSLLGVGLTVRVTVSQNGQGVVLVGKITAINPQVDATNRNVQVQATIANPEERLRPGMFAQVAVILPDPEPVQVIPETAVLYAPYSDSVYVIEKGEKGLTVRQQFVRLGERRGDFVAVRSGLKPGEQVVSTGVFKLRNGQSVKIDNTLSPKFQRNPRPENS